MTEKEKAWDELVKGVSSIQEDPKYDLYDEPEQMREKAIAELVEKLMLSYNA